MIRTKDFVVILVAVMLATIGAGFFFVSSDAPPSMVKVEDIFFSEPQAGYGVISSTRTDDLGNRDAFIERVRRAYVPKTSPEPEPMPVVIESEASGAPLLDMFAPSQDQTSEILPFPTSTTTGTTSSEESAEVDSSI